MTKTKVIGVGFHKTGTTTLGHCLRLLGYQHESVRKDTFQMYLRGDTESLVRFLEKIDSCEDWPWPLVYKDLYEAYPDAKYILTVRKDPEAWFSSVDRHVKRGAGSGFKYRKHIYGYQNPSDAKDIYVEKYLGHNKDVEEFFTERGASFTKLCWELGDGWNELCRFLDEPVPDVPFPVANKDPGMLHGKLDLGRRALRKTLQTLAAPLGSTRR